MKKKFLSIVAVLATLCYVVSTGPARHSHNEDVLSESVVYIVNKAQNMGGTGFHVKSPSGAKYIMTNGHVCSDVGENGLLYIKFKEDEQPTPRRIIEESPLTDLCLVEAMPNGKPLFLDVANPEPFNVLHAVGHPNLLPLTLTEGRAIGPKQSLIPLFLGTDHCDSPKHKKGEVPLFMFMVPACFLNITSIATTIQIMGGSSGSPVLNQSGKVAGVAFAATSELGWALIIPITDVNKFLSKY